MHVSTAPPPYVTASSSSKRSRITTDGERRAAEEVDDVHDDEEEEKMRKDLVDEFCSEQEDYIHEVSEDEAVATALEEGARAAPNEAESTHSRCEDMNGRHLAGPDESYTIPSRARLSSHLRTVVGHAQIHETAPSSGDSKGTFTRTFYCHVILFSVLLALLKHHIHALDRRLESDSFLYYHSESTSQDRVGS